MSSPLAKYWGHGSLPPGIATHAGEGRYTIIDHDLASTMCIISLCCKKCDFGCLSVRYGTGSRGCTCRNVLIVNMYALDGFSK